MYSRKTIEPLAVTVQVIPLLMILGMTNNLFSYLNLNLIEYKFKFIKYNKNVKSEN